MRKIEVSIKENADGKMEISIDHIGNESNYSAENRIANTLFSAFAKTIKEINNKEA